MCLLAGGLFYSVFVWYFGDGEGIREGLYYISNGRGGRLSVIFIGRCWIVERRCNDLGVLVREV